MVLEDLEVLLEEVTELKVQIQYFQLLHLLEEVTEEDPVPQILYLVILVVLEEVHIVRQQHLVMYLQ